MKIVRIPRVILFSALVFCSVGAAARLSAADRYVALSGDNTGGTSWDTAYTSLQDAINASAEGDVIHVKGDTYSLTTQILWANKTNLTVKGGYEGTGAPGASDPARWPTILGRADGSICRILHMDGAVNATLSGVTVTGGLASNTVASAHAYGGGLYILNSTDVTLSACTITNNTVEKYGTGGFCHNYGGGVCIEASAVTLADSLVAENMAAVMEAESWSDARGGGIAALGSTSTVILSNSVVRGNGAIRSSAGGWPCGGGIFSAEGTFQIENCLIYGNNASDENSWGQNTKYSGRGDGLYGTAFTVRNSTLAFNMGEGLYQSGGTSTFTDCIVWGNGDDIAGSSANVTLAHCNVGRFDGDEGTALIYDDPQFDRGFYLKPGSPCVDAGSTTAAEAGLDARTTQANGAADAGTVDLGYHAAAGTTAPPVVTLHVATTGSDATGDGSAAKPYRSITKALTVLPDWGTLHIGPGTYTASSGEVFPCVLDNRIGLSFIGNGATLDNEKTEGRRILEINNCLNIAFSGLVLTGGYATEEESKSIYGGAVLIVHGGGIRFTDCTIRDSVAQNKKIKAYNIEAYGGGIASCGTSLLLERCTIQNNDLLNRTHISYGNGGRGGGVAVVGGLANLVNCTIVGNRTSAVAKNGGGRGAGVYNKGGTTWIYDSLIVSNNTYAPEWQRTGVGDGVFNSDNGSFSFLVMENCTVADNVNAESTTSSGVYNIANGSCDATLRNCIVVGHEDDVYNSKTINVHTSCIGTEDTFWTDGVDGCILLKTTDPLFKDRASGDYRLAYDAVVKDRGENRTWWMDYTLDLAGNPRIVHDVVDMGCYEIQKARGTIFLLR
ncbi:MAG: DUF1565 domain-containing protein [Kiritimatiellia bacterium]